MGVSQADYARHRQAAGLPGGTRQAVNLAVKDGRITLLPDRTIDPALADAQWAANTSSSEPTPQTAAALPKHVKVTRPDVPIKAEEEAKLSRVKRERAELEFAVRRGELLPAVDVRQAVIDGFRKLRDKIRAVPSQVAQDVAAETDVARCAARILEGLDQALGELAAVADAVAPEVVESGEGE